MNEIRTELPTGSWAAIGRQTALLVAFATAISLSFTFFITGTNVSGLVAATVLPILLGTPLSIWHLYRLQQFRLANQRLHVLASTDWLTSCLNRRAFTHLVTDHLTDVPVGAFLVIDADHFKLINDDYGHDRGDEALQLMASIIKANVREEDLVGRIGGEEFGVFLKGASLEVAQVVAERIRNAIDRAAFAPEGRKLSLSVSVGGAFYDGQITFSDLFRIADQRLYGAKQSGRNRVEVVHANGDLTAEAAA